MIDQFFDAKYFIYFKCFWIIYQVNSGFQDIVLTQVTCLVIRSYNMWIAISLIKKVNK